MFGSQGSGGRIVRNPPRNGRPFRRKRIPGGPRSLGGAADSSWGTPSGGASGEVLSRGASHEVPDTS